MKKRLKSILCKICPIFACCMLIISLVGVTFVSADESETESETTGTYDPIIKPDDAPFSLDILGSVLLFSASDSNDDEFATYFPFSQLWRGNSTSRTPSYDLIYLESDATYTYGQVSISQSVNSRNNDVLSILFDASSGSPFRTFESALFKFETGDFFLYTGNNQFSFSGDAYSTTGDATTTIHIVYQYTGSTTQYYYSISFVGEWVFTALDFLNAIEYDGLPLFVDSVVITTSFSEALPTDSFHYSFTSTLSEYWGVFQNHMYNTNLNNVPTSDPDPDPDPDPDIDIELIFRDYTSWIATAVGAFFSFQLFPGFYLGGILVIIIAFSLVMWWLKMFGGG